MISVTVSPLRMQAGQETDLAITLTNVGKGTCRNVVFHLDLPWQVARLSGGGQIDAERLAEGESVRSLVRVRAENTGSWPVRSSNFSYRNRHGSTVRPDDYTELLTVEPMVRVETAPPRLSAELVDGELALSQWGTVSVRLSNTGKTLVRGIELSVRGQLQFDQPLARLSELPPSESITFPFAVLPKETGAVPIHVELSGRYSQPEQPVRQQWSMKVDIGSPAAGAGPTTVLYVSANPDGTMPTHAAAEARHIRKELGSKPGFRLEERGAIGPRELTDALVSFRPRIVHLASHGEDGYLYLEREKGQPHIVSPQSMADLFQEAADYVAGVIIGACDSEALAKAVGEHIDYVIAVDGRLTSSVAIAFSIGFYQAFAAGNPIEKSFRYGCRLIRLELGDDFADHPVRLYRRQAGGVDVVSG